MAVTNLGNIAIVPDGQWSSAKAYTRNRLVYHTNGNSYVARKDVPAGTAITNDEYWQLSGAKGLDGDVTTAAMNDAIEYAVAQAENGLQEQINDAFSGILGHTSRIVDLEADVAVLDGATTAAQARTNLGITPSNIGAAPITHTHTAGDITTVISVGGGGTGVTTVSEIAALLGLSTSTTTTVATTSTIGTVDYFRLHKVGKVVTFNMRYASTIQSGGNTDAAIIPEAYRPADSIVALSAYQGATATIVKAYVKNDGTIMLRTSADISDAILSGTWVAS